MPPLSELLGYTPVDIHSHLDHGAAGDFQAIVSPVKVNVHTMTAEKLRPKYDAAGIGSVCFSTYDAVTFCDRIAEENEFLHRYVQQTPWAYQWVVVNPSQPETFRQAETMLACPKTVGIKLHPQRHGYDILEHGDKLFSFAHELGAVVQMHPAQVPKMPAFADKYPNMQLIIAHIGNEEYIDAIAAAKHKNIWVDTSGSASTLNCIIERAVERVGSDRILFGTDTYFASLQLARIAWAGISDTDKKNILRDNAERLFGCF